MTFTFVLAILGAWLIIKFISPGRRKWFWCLLVIVLLVSNNNGSVITKSSSSSRDLGTIDSNKEQTINIHPLFQGENNFSDIRLHYSFTKKGEVEVMEPRTSLNGMVFVGWSFVFLKWGLRLSDLSVTAEAPEKSGEFFIYPVHVKYKLTYQNKVFFYNETCIRNESVFLRIKRPISQIPQEIK